MKKGSRAFVALFAAMALAAPLAAEAGGQEEAARPSRIDLVLPAPAGAKARFRFLPDGAWARYDRELRLSAAPGESRSYRLEIEDEAGQRSVFAYVVDKRPPEPPAAEPAGGLLSAPSPITLRCEAGARAYWALFGPGAESPSFEPYDPDSPPRIAPPGEGTASYTLVAYAEDGAGNRSAPRRFAYRAAAAGLQAEAPAQDRPEASLAADPALPAPKAESAPGSADLAFALPAGARLLAAVGVDAAPARLSGYAQIESKDGVAHLVLSCPYGWRGKVRLFFGVIRGGAASYYPAPLDVELSYPARESPPPAEPLPPSLVSDLGGRGSFIAFPPYDGSIYVSLDGSEPKPYLGPIGAPSGEEAVELSWYGEDGSAQRSAVRTARLALPRPAPTALLEGVADGAVVGALVRLTPAARGAIRYTVSEAAGRASANVPQEPSADSDLLGEGLSLDCPPGEERSFALRYRPFADASPGSVAGESRTLRFTIDRKPPLPPSLSAQPPAYSDRSTLLSFVPGEEGSTVFASVEIEGRAAPFLAPKGPVELPGDDAGPVAYRLRAYRVDAAGNRSDEMQPVSVVVDRSSVYAAEDAADPGDGSPTRPFRSLDAALAAAIAGGKRSLNIRGSLEARRPVVLPSGSLALVGGFGPGWAKDPSARARLRASGSGSASPFAIKGASLSLRSLDLGFEPSGGAPLFDLAGGSLELADCAISASGAGDLLFVAASSAKLSFIRTTISAEKAMSCAVVKAEGTELALRESIVSAKPGVRAFVAFDLEGGSLEATGSLIESSADLALRLLSLKDARLLMDRCLVKADTGSGFLRLGSFARVEGEVRNSRFIVSWKGEGLLFESSGACPAFRHDTISAETSRGKLGFFSADGVAPEVWNCILSCASGGGVMLRSDAKPPAGSLVADCLWGFDLLVDGPWKAASLKELDSLNAANASFASRRHLSEPPTKTFSAPIKSLSPLSRNSACVGAAYPLEGEAYARDFKGAPRPSPSRAGGASLPDIGADEATD